MLSRVEVFMGCVKSVGLESLCDAALTSLFSISWPSGAAISGGVCSALVQAYTTGKIDGWQVALSGGLSYASAKLRLGKIWDTAMTAVSFGMCLVDGDFFRVSMSPRRPRFQTRVALFGLGTEGLRGSPVERLAASSAEFPRPLAPSFGLAIASGP